MQPGIPASTRDEFIVSALLNDPARLEHDDSMSGTHGGESVRDDKARPSDHQSGQGLTNLLLGLDVERRGGLIKNKDAGIANQRSRDSQALALSTRESRTPLADACVPAIWE